MNEAQTRAELIDPKLKESGWGVVEGSKVRKRMVHHHQVRRFLHEFSR